MDIKILFNKHCQGLVYYGCKFIADIQVVEDIVTEAFLRYDKACYTDERFLYLFVKQRCLNHIRDLKQRPVVEISESLLNQPIENEIIETGLLSSLQGCIDKLPPESKKVLLMFYIDGKECKQIALELGKPESTIRSIKRYAVYLLRNMIKK